MRAYFLNEYDKMWENMGVVSGKGFGQWMNHSAWITVII